MISTERFAEEAIRKLYIAFDKNTCVYIYGATGFGKTSAVERVFDRSASNWISCAEPEDTVLSKLQNCDNTRYVVVDDTQYIDDSAIQQKIISMIDNEGYKMVLIGRTGLPSWLSHLALQSRLIVITEDDLRVTRQELARLCQSNGLKMTDEHLMHLIEVSEGNAMILDLFSHRYKQGNTDEESLLSDIKKVFIDYMNENVISSWSRDVQDFLMQISVVDSFTLELAEYITGDDNCASLLSRAEKAGNFLQCSNGEWHIRSILLEILRERALRTYGHNFCDRLLYNAGRYYEMNGDAVKALTIYKQYGDEESMRLLLVREARKHPGTDNFWLLKDYYLSLNEKDIEREPVLMNVMSMLYSVMMNTERSEYWYSKLKEYITKAKGDDFNEAYLEKIILDIGLPHRGSNDIAGLLKAIPTIFFNSSVVLRNISLTNNQPSLMNGGKDFCEWSKKDELLANTIGPVVEKMLGKTGAGLVQIALGESSYEKGTNSFEVLTYLTKGQNQTESNGTVEMTWVSVALQARIAIFSGDREYANKLINGMLKRAEREKKKRLEETVRAFSCRVSLYLNETSRIRDWTDNAPDETIEFCTLNRYLYITKIQCYIALGRNNEAITLLKRMMAYASYSQRSYIKMECGLLYAIVMKRTGNHWKGDFMAVLQDIGGYHFIPIVSEKGAAILPLLTDIKAVFCRDNPQYVPWFEQVMKETTKTARYYPDYLTGTGIDISRFSDTALQVLRMQAAGLTAKEISEALNITQRTVKYHASENYRKLDARNLVEAVQIAQSLNIL